LPGWAVETLCRIETGNTTATDRLWLDPARLMREAKLGPDPWQAAFLESMARQSLLLCSRQSGKSTVAAALALVTALREAPALVLLLSPTLRQSGELFRAKVLPMYKGLAGVAAIFQQSALQMELANGSRIISLPGDEETIRGYSGVSLLVVDEASRVPDDLYKSVRPMLAVSGGRLVALSTPFGKRGWFYHEWFGEGGWERTRITAYQCPRIPQSFLDEERRALGDSWYSQEYGCEFTDGTGSPLFPPEWLNRAEVIAKGLKGRQRKALAIGCDPAEGGDFTTWAVVDEFGLMALFSEKTADTSVITGRTIALMRQYGVDATKVAFDSGGGGKQHADRLRAQGYNVKTVAFGESVTPELKRGMTPLVARIDGKEDRYVYTNRRAELYGTLRLLLDPSNNPRGFGLPSEYTELRRQLAPIPLTYDHEGRLRLLPKNKRSANSTEKTLVELIGRSPDDADALCLACWSMMNKPQRARAGVS
jgi:hypothetical protein